MTKKEKGQQLYVENTIHVCTTNLIFLLFIFIAVGFSHFENRFKIQAIILHYNLIFCAVLFNCTTMQEWFSWTGTSENDQDISLSSSNMSANISQEDEATSSKSHQTPEMEMVQTDARGTNKEKAWSEPTKTAFGYLSTKPEKLSVAPVKYIQVKSPELFKNKMYQTRKILLNGHDD